MTAPKFAARAQLVRYIPEIDRLSGNRPAVAAFLPAPPSASAADDYLSVNSLEVESLKDIATYHRWRQGNVGKAALCVHKVHDYNDAGKKSGVQISYDHPLSRWRFRGSSPALEDAYRYRPVLKYDNPYGSPSHCGVEFTRALRDHAAAKFARRLSAKGRFHLL